MPLFCPRYRYDANNEVLSATRLYRRPGRKEEELTPAQLISRWPMDKKAIIKSIDTEGFAVIEDFISPETLDKFMPEVYRRFDRLSHNGTKGYVGVRTQKYLQDTLTIHEEVLKIYLHPFIIDCCEEYTGTSIIKKRWPTRRKICWIIKDLSP